MKLSRKLRRYKPTEDLMFQVRVPKEMYWRYVYLVSLVMESIENDKPVDARVLSLLSRIVEAKDMSQIGTNAELDRLIDEQAKAISETITPKREYSFVFKKEAFVPSLFEIPPIHKEPVYVTYDLTFFVRNLLREFHYKIPQSKLDLGSTVDRNEVIKALYNSFIELMNRMHFYNELKNKEKEYFITRYKILVIILNVVHHLGFYIGQYPDKQKNKYFNTIGENALKSKGERERNIKSKAAR